MAKAFDLRKQLNSNVAFNSTSGFASCFLQTAALKEQFDLLQRALMSSYFGSAVDPATNEFFDCMMKIEERTI